MSGDFDDENFERAFKAGQESERLRTMKLIDNVLDMLKHGTICIHPSESHDYCKKFNECTGCVLDDLKNKIKEPEKKEMGK